MILPKGIRIEGICTPKRHFDIVVRIPIVSPRGSEKNDCHSPLTSLGHNPTQLSLHSQRIDQDKPSPSCVKRRSYASLAQTQTDDEKERLSQPPVPREHLKMCNLAPQPVVVDGCGDSILKKLVYKDSTERDKPMATLLPSYAEPIEDLQSKDNKVPAQPVVVDGCGEHTAPVFKTECSPWKISPTAIWTAIPEEPSDIRNPEQLPEKTECRIGDGEQLKQNCEERIRKDGRTGEIIAPNVGNGRQGGSQSEGQSLPGRHELQDQIKTYQALEPIPESDGYGANCDEILSIGSKPKALPLKVTQTVKQCLAKISAAGATQKHLATKQNGSMPALSQVENRKTLCEATPSPMEEEPALTGKPDIHAPANHTERSMPGNRPVIQLGESIRTIQRSRSAGHPPLTPNRKTSFDRQQSVLSTNESEVLTDQGSH